MDRAERTLYRFSAEFRDFKKQQAEAKKSEEFAKQGQLLADAISSKFEEAIHQIKQTVGQQPQPVPGQASFPPPPPPGGTGQINTLELAVPAEPKEPKEPEDNNKLSPVQKAPPTNSTALLWGMTPFMTWMVRRIRQ